MECEALLKEVEEAQPVPAKPATDGASSRR